jgi:hypothetical protein
MILSVESCKKNSQAITNSDIVGVWTWINSSSGNSILITQSSSVQKTLFFTEDGKVYISHNDSTGDFPNVQIYEPLVILA